MSLSVDTAESYERTVAAHIPGVAYGQPSTDSGLLQFPHFSSFTARSAKLGGAGGILVAGANRLGRRARGMGAPARTPGDIHGDSPGGAWRAGGD